MMKRLAFVLVISAFAGCGGGDDTPPAVDGPPMTIDGPPGQIDAMVRVCNGMPYDKCVDTTNWTDCMGGMECRFFMGDGITECTPTCSGAMPCPNDEAGNPVASNMMGRCKANPPNSCTLP